MRARRRALMLEIHRMVSRYSSDRFDLQDSESAFVLLFVFRCCRSVVSILLSVTSTWQIPAAPCAPAAEAPSHTSIEICPKNTLKFWVWRSTGLCWFGTLLTFICRNSWACVWFIIDHVSNFEIAAPSTSAYEIQLRSFLLGSSTCKLVSFFEASSFAPSGQSAC